MWRPGKAFQYYANATLDRLPHTHMPQSAHGGHPDLCFRLAGVLSFVRWPCPPYRVVVCLFGVYGGL